jgi:SAM-dependent methyltransferase
MKSELERQLGRQALWLKESYLWLLITKVLPPGERSGRPTALDVGCGPGYIMDILKSALDVKGVDIDNDVVEMCKARGLEARRAPAEKLPFKDGSFDIVYCTFLLLWTKDPAKVLGEMARVSRKWVLCLAEPDYGARIDHPRELADIGKLVADVLVDEGADPHVGRKLRSLSREAGIDAEVGIHAGVWDLERLRREFEDEWAWVEKAGRARKLPAGKLRDWKRAWSVALEKGGLFQFNPIFYAIGKRQ